MFGKHNQTSLSIGEHSLSRPVTHPIAVEHVEVPTKRYLYPPVQGLQLAKVNRPGIRGGCLV